MTYEELVRHVAEENEMTYAAAERAVRSTFSGIKEYVLDGGRIVVPKFGSFRTRRMRSKGLIKGRAWETEPHITMAFRPSSKAKDLI